MSGGHFDYLFGRVNDFAEQLEIEIYNNQKKDDWGDSRNYSPRAILTLKEILQTCRRTAKLMREVEWLYSGDTGEKEFLERVEEIESEVKE